MESIHTGGVVERKKRAIQDQGTQTIPLPLPVQKKAASRTWAALIKKIYEVDPLVCKKCGGAMKIIAFVQDPHEVRCLLSSLHLPDFYPPPPLLSPSIKEPILELMFDDFDTLVQ